MYKNFILSAVVLLSVFISFNTFATEKNKDLYFTLGIGNGNLDINSDFFPLFPESSSTTSSTQSLGVGYIFNKYISLEFEYSKLGSYDVSSTINGNYYKQKIDIDLKQLSLFITKDIRSYLSIFAELGIARTNETYSATGVSGIEPYPPSPGTSVYINVENGSNENMVNQYGLGISGKITDNLSVRYIWRTYPGLDKGIYYSLYTGLTTNFINIVYKF
jgi:hypothetical protein